MYEKLCYIRAKLHKMAEQEDKKYYASERLDEYADGKGSGLDTAVALIDQLLRELEPPKEGE